MKGHFLKTLSRSGLLLAATLALTGCSELWCWPFDCSSSGESSSGIDDSGNTATSASAVNPVAQNNTAPITPGGNQEFDLNRAVYLHTNVSSWPETHKLTVELGAGVICLNGGFSTAWPAASIDHTSGQYKISVNANPWVFVRRGDKWYGGTWEWFAVGNTCKPARNVEGGHIKIPPLADWTPVSGETVYFMVSSIARGSNLNNYQGRTNAVKVIWP